MITEVNKDVWAFLKQNGDGSYIVCRSGHVWDFSDRDIVNRRLFNDSIKKDPPSYVIKLKSKIKPC